MLTLFDLVVIGLLSHSIEYTIVFHAPAIAWMGSFENSSNFVLLGADIGCLFANFVISEEYSSWVVCIIRLLYMILLYIYNYFVLHQIFNFLILLEKDTTPENARFLSVLSDKTGSLSFICKPHKTAPCILDTSLHEATTFCILRQLLILMFKVLEAYVGDHGNHH